MTASKGQVLAADGRPLKASLNSALRRQKVRALLLIAPLLLFIMITFIAPIGQMLMRSVENGLVSETLPRTTNLLATWDSSETDLPDDATFLALAQDMMLAVEEKNHTRLGSRLNYEMTGVSSLFRKSGRAVDEFGEIAQEALIELNETFEDPVAWSAQFGAPDWVSSVNTWVEGGENGLAPEFQGNPEMLAAFPLTTGVYADFANFVASDGDNPLEEDVWPIIYHTLAVELADADEFVETGLPLAAAQGTDIPTGDLRALFADVDEDWLNPEVWRTTQTYSTAYTAGYFLTSIDRQLTPDGIEATPEDERIYITLFVRTLVMSMVITLSCIMLGYPVAWLLANLPMRTANVLMILVLLPFWTSLLVRTSAWKALLQNQGVINDLMVWVGLYADDNRLALINNATGTIIAMTHILLPFMILPLYSVMKTISPTYVRAAKSLGATDWTSFWRVYFPQSVPGIGAGSILVFILSIGYYITPEIVGGTKGVFISNRIAFHISNSLNWGLAAALGTILLALVLIFYWLYDRIVGIDNVKLGG